jgi:hypothetical protein
MLDAKIAQVICPSGKSLCAGEGATNSAVVLAKASTHTAESVGETHLVDDRANDIALW